MSANGGEKRKPLIKWAFRGVCPSSFYGAKAASFPFNDFKDKVNPYIDQEKEKWKGVKLPRAGIGCWNPVFPARADDIWMMTSVAVKEIEEIVNDVWQGLRIFSLKKYEQSFVGVEQMLLG